MVVYIREKITFLLKMDFVRFCIVGALGFAINFALLAILYKKIGLPIFLAQVFGAEIALGNNFILHHRWTYKGHNVKKSISQLLIQFHMTSWVAIIGSAALVSLGVHTLHLHFGIALAISSVAALGWNYGWTKFVIWRDVHVNELNK